MSAHTLFSPSSADRWTACPGSVALNMNESGRGGASADEGTMLHDVMVKHLRDGVPLSDFDLTAEQRACCTQCADFVNEKLQGERFFEMRVPFGEAIGQPDKEAAGTTDLAVLDGTTLHVADYKFGHQYVDVVDNRQGLLYAIGTTLLLEGLGYQIDTINIYILQPRTGNYVSNGDYSISRADLEQWAATFKFNGQQVKFALATHKTGDWDKFETYLMPGEKQCKYCRGAHKCPAIRKQAQEVSEAFLAEFDLPASDQAVKEKAAQLSDDRLKESLDMLPVLKRFISVIETEGLRRALSGQAIPEYKLIAGRAGNRKWTDEEAAKAKLIAAGVGEDEVYRPLTIVTPAEAETLIIAATGVKKKEASSIIEELTARPAPKPALVPASSSGGTPWTGSFDVNEFDVVEDDG